MPSEIRLGGTVVDLSELAARDRSPRFTVLERVCLTRDGRVVREDELVGGGTLLFPAGAEIPIEEARRYGLVPEQAAPQVAAEVPAAPAAKATTPAPQKGK